MIVGDLLNFARQQEVLAQDTDVNRLLDRAVESVRSQPAFQGVELVRQLLPDLPVIEADPSQILQVFINLLNNAAEAISGRGKVTLTSRLAGPWIEVEVTDTGCGIPEENLGKLFTPFFTTKALGRGTGLGLSIVYGIIKMHRGHIAVRSGVGQGTTFTVSRPRRLAHGDPPGPQTLRLPEASL